MTQLIFAIAAGLIVSNSAMADANWRITKPAWTASDERGYSTFVHDLGVSGCASISACLKGPANPYRKTDPADASFVADCAKLPYILRGYFAWKNGLPFSYINSVKPNGDSTDIRYTPNGNLVSGRRDIVEGANYVQGIQALKRMHGEVDSAMFRMSPETDGNTPLFPDFYSAGITRGGIRPGTMIYDPAGHVAVVYDIADDGRILYMDAHPDNSLTHGQYGEKFERSRPTQGAGFKNFRPLQLVGAVQQANGEWTGGGVHTVLNKDIKDFSLEQYYGNKPAAVGWSKGLFVFKGAATAYYDYVRLALAKGDLKYNPVTELTTMMTAICQDIQDRVVSVQAAVDAGANVKDHPVNLPMNIYGTDGDWESYSTPSRDARLKTSFREIRTQIQKLNDLFHKGSPLVAYKGNNLGADLRAAYQTAAAQSICQFAYSRTDKSVVKLSYDDVQARLFKLSFDLYHCPELRWGAGDGRELATCQDSTLKQDWYAAEQNLRNQVERTYQAPMGFSLDQLQQHAPGSGVAGAPDVDLKTYLKNL